jgi:hypothetical protein
MSRIGKIARLPGSTLLRFLAAVVPIGQTPGSRSGSQSVAASGNASTSPRICGGQDGAEKSAKKSEKCEKWNFVISQLEPAVVQFIPTKMEPGDFSDFSKNFRGWGGAKNGRIMKAEARNELWCPCESLDPRAKKSI